MLRNLPEGLIPKDSRLPIDGRDLFRKIVGSDERREILGKN